MTFLLKFKQLTLIVFACFALCVSFSAITSGTIIGQNITGAAHAAPVKAKRNKHSASLKKTRRVRYRAPWRCVPPRLKKVIQQISRKFGPVTINSTHRSRGKNKRIGGKRKSYHLSCKAVDFRVRGRTKGLTRWLARHPKVGGFKRYRAGFYHIDTGPKRTW